MPATHDNAGIAAWRFKMHAQIASFADCERAVELLDPHGDHDGLVPIGPRMTLIHEGHPADVASTRTYAIELYDTKIVRYYPDGTLSVDNGGHATPTTRERMEACLPNGWRVFHHKKKLGVSVPSHIGSAGERWPLTHGVRLSAETGDIIEVPQPHVNIGARMVMVDLPAAEGPGHRVAYHMDSEDLFARLDNIDGFDGFDQTPGGAFGFYVARFTSDCTLGDDELIAAVQTAANETRKEA